MTWLSATVVSRVRPRQAAAGAHAPAIHVCLPCLGARAPQLDRLLVHLPSAVSLHAHMTGSLCIAADEVAQSVQGRVLLKLEGCTLDSAAIFHGYVCTFMSQCHDSCRIKQAPVFDVQLQPPSLLLCSCMPSPSACRSSEVGLAVNPFVQSCGRCAAVRGAGCCGRCSSRLRLERRWSFDSRTACWNSSSRARRGCPLSRCTAVRAGALPFVHCRSFCMSVCSSVFLSVCLCV